MAKYNFADFRPDIDNLVTIFTSKSNNIYAKAGRDIPPASLGYFLTRRRQHRRREVQYRLTKRYSGCARLSAPGQSRSDQD